MGHPSPLYRRRHHPTQPVRDLCRFRNMGHLSAFLLLLLSFSSFLSLLSFFFPFACFSKMHLQIFVSNLFHLYQSKSLLNVNSISFSISTILLSLSNSPRLVSLSISI